jgi:hypothetical protein
MIQLSVSGIEKLIFPLNEFNLSINKSDLKDDNTENRYGFGLGMYHSFRSNNIVNIVLGIEYNMTSQFKKYMTMGITSHIEDVTYHLNDLSIPLLIRINYGNKTKLFFETGPFLDLNIKTTRQTKDHSVDDEEKNISEVNYGISIGIGIKIPVSKYEIIIKPEYKLGLHKIYDYHESIYNKYMRLVIGIKMN